jgi:hypothetical protein
VVSVEVVQIQTEGRLSYGQVVTGAVLAPPTVLVEDQYGNPVPGVAVDFTGDGSIGSDGVTSGSGQISTTWSADVADGALQTDGTFPNTLTATVEGTGFTTTFDADAIYSYDTHVDPLWALSTASGGLGCTGCHGAPPGLGELSLTGSPATNYDELINSSLFCDNDGSALPAQYRLVSTAGGLDASEDFSILMRYIDSELSVIGACNEAHVTRTDPGLAIVRAWIRNGAPNN